jgi:hypothetical protein
MFASQQTNFLRYPEQDAAPFLFSAQPKAPSNTYLPQIMHALTSSTTYVHTRVLDEHEHDLNGGQKVPLSPSTEQLAV